MENRALRLKSLVEQPGWADVVEYVKGELADSMTRFEKLMDKTPTKLLEKSAYQARGERVALKRLMTWIENQVSNDV